MESKAFELIIRKTEWPEEDGLETEFDVYNPECSYIYAGSPKITDIHMIEKSAYTKAIDALKGISLETCTIGDLPTNTAYKAQDILRELGEL